MKIKIQCIKTVECSYRSTEKTIALSAYILEEKMGLKSVT